MARPAKDLDDDTGPERTCVVTRVQRPPDEMIRFVLDPGRQVVPDLRRKLPGRGVWVTAEARYVEEAVKRGAFARGFKRPVSILPGLVELIASELEKDVLQSLSMANKAGLVAAGAFQVEKTISEGEIAVLLHARDGSADGMRKIRQVLKRVSLEPRSGLEPRNFTFRANRFGIGADKCGTCSAQTGRGGGSADHARPAIGGFSGLRARKPVCRDNGIG